MECFNLIYDNDSSPMLWLKLTSEFSKQTESHCQMLLRALVQ